MTEDIPPLCIHCRFHEQRWRFGGHECKRRVTPPRFNRDPVTGVEEPVGHVTSCDKERDSFFLNLNACGPEGKHFEPKADAAP